MTHSGPRLSRSETRDGGRERVGSREPTDHEKVRRRGNEDVKGYEPDGKG